MKKIKNMSIDEARQAFFKFDTKHKRKDDFDMNILQIHQYDELLQKASKEDLTSLLYDLFNYGFMAGYKQSESDLKAKIDDHMYSDTQRQLLEFVYYLPFGRHAELFYHFMIYHFKDDELEALLPNRIAKPALAVKKEAREEEARKEAERKERQKVIDEALKQYELQKNK